MSKILVTGGAGFIGSHIVDALVARGDDVVVLDDLSTGKRENIAHHQRGVTFIQGDIRDASTVAKAVAGCHYIIHEAGLASVPKSFERPDDFYDVNVNGMFNLCTAAKAAGVKRIVWASSSSVYGDSTKLPQREGDEGICLSPYALTKKAAEDIARFFWKAHGLETVSLRYFNVFGPRQDPNSPYAAAIPKFISALKAGKSPTVFGDGEQTRDFTYVANVVDANLRALTAPAEKVAGGVFNVALGKPTSVNQILTSLNEILGTKIKPVHEPPRAGDIPRSCADISHATAALGLREVVSGKEGLSKTVASFK